MLLSWILLAMQPAAAKESIKKALEDGKVHLDLRFRFEHVDQTGFDLHAEAWTLRLRLGYETASYRGMFAYADFEGIVALGAEKYNSTANGKTDFPVVADPADEELNQGYVGYKSPGDTTFKLGRQRIVLGNSRFVGDVGFRQNAQTYDALSVRSEFTDRIDFFYGHINNVNRIFGAHHPDPALANTNLFGDAIHVEFELGGGQLTGYAHFLEFEDDPAVSHKNFGLRFAGDHVLSDGLALLYTAEYTDQSGYKDAADTVDASYYFLEAGVKLRRVISKIGYEVLGGDGVYGFQTPLATLHKFNGWADKFVATPDSGLRDLYVSVSGDVWGYKLIAIYHDFRADSGGSDYGSELDFVARRVFREHYGVEVKFASYNANDFSVRTEKLWLTASAKF